MWDGTVEAAVFRLSPQAQLAGRATPPPGRSAFVLFRRGRVDLRSAGRTNEEKGARSAQEEPHGP